MSLNLTNFPELLGNALGIGTFAGGILASIIFMAMWLLPLNLLVKRLSFLPNFVIMFCLLSFTIAIGWMPIWIMLMICLITAGMYAGIWKQVFK